MPRPSLKDQRSGEILDAYVTCVARFGLEGATQERIAAEAGVKRPILRHYLGNKDQMTAALAAHVVASFAASTDAFGAALEAVDSPSGLVAMLFDTRDSHDPRLMLAWQALTASAGDNPGLQAQLLGSLERFLDVIEAALARMCPGADPASVRAAAQGISSAYVNLDAMSPLSPPSEWRAELRQAAEMLAASLDGSA
jgi:AcrR family transcriptional regulator